jgi:hypothetical protein
MLLPAATLSRLPNCTACCSAAAAPAPASMPRLAGRCRRTAGNRAQDNVRNALIGLQEMVKGELTGDDVTVVLLLPTDDAR